MADETLLSWIVAICSRRKAARGFGSHPLRSWSQMLKGCTFWPMSDADPQANDPSSAFYRLGVLKATLADKPAAARMRANWA